MSDDVEGFYSAYLSGKNDSGFAMVVLKDGLLAGADPLGVTLDGHYRRKKAGDGYDGKVTVKVPSGGTTIQGASTGPDGMTYEVALSLPIDFKEQPFVRIDTPLGPVNAKFIKVRSF